MIARWASGILDLSKPRGIFSFHRVEGVNRGRRQILIPEKYPGFLNTDGRHDHILLYFYAI